MGLFCYRLTWSLHANENILLGKFTLFILVVWFFIRFGSISKNIEKYNYSQLASVYCHNNILFRVVQYSEQNFSKNYSKFSTKLNIQFYRIIIGPSQTGDGSLFGWLLGFNESNYNSKNFNTDPSMVVTSHVLPPQGS